MIRVGEMGGQSGVVGVEDIRSVLSFLEVGDFEDRWRNFSGGDGILENIRGSVKESGRRTFF